MAKWWQPLMLGLLAATMLCTRSVGGSAVGPVPRLAWGLHGLQSQSLVFAKTRLLEEGKPLARAIQAMGKKAAEVNLSVLASAVQRTCNKSIALSRALVSLVISAARSSPSWKPWRDVPILKQLSLIATAAGAVLRPKSAFAGVLRNMQQLNPFEKCATTPVFFVCSSRGHPYLQEDVQVGKPGQKMVTYYMSYQDAEAHLNEMTQSNYPHVNECRIMAMSMERALGQIRAKKQSRKLGRYDVDVVYRIQAAAKQVENAAQLQPAQAKSGGLSVPMFAARGLSIARGNNEVVTPYYFALEDLMQDWQRLAKISPSLPTQPNIEVKELGDVLVLSDQISFGGVAGVDSKPLHPIGIVPPREEIDAVRQYYRRENGLLKEYAKARLVLGK